MIFLFISFVKMRKFCIESYLGFFCIVSKPLRICSNTSSKLNLLQNAIPGCCEVGCSILVWPSIYSYSFPNLKPVCGSAQVDA